MKSSSRYDSSAGGTWQSNFDNFLTSFALITLSTTAAATHSRYG